ncbi:putative Kinase protein with adenine nucleotide alpha hydrolases-like domain [Hibiscus syriacus]|uniref:Kinase protein with adenine nucleotide alpha hydrolases-like domain n=1 Tax=Hibiscus syriacus TaxID=106335 RepID=A0A6A3CAQ6_HIBSY|nr:putative Kinase protein with adenine nucleotide alpha hydrolases-like domain [Hibiscus syriacus]
MSKGFVSIVLALATGLLQLANAEVPAIFILGDSTADVGTNNYLPDSNITANYPHNGVDFPFGRETGRFSNGLNTADFLARLFGFKRSPLSFLAFNGTYGIKKRQSETEEFLSKSLFFISVGSNDIMGNYHSNYPIPKEQFIPKLAVVYEKHLRNLISVGARRFGIIGVPPVGCCPSQRLSANGECVKDLNDQAEAFFSTMDTLMRNLNFIDVKNACCGNGTLKAESFCTPSAKLCSNCHQYLFWDLFHPAQAASKMVAFKVYSGEPEYVTPINFSQLADAY